MNAPVNMFMNTLMNTPKNETPNVEPSNTYETPLLVEVGGFVECTQGGPHEVPEGGKWEMAW